MFSETFRERSSFFYGGKNVCGHNAYGSYTARGLRYIRRAKERNIMKKYRAGVIGATGTAGRTLVSLLQKHPYFQPTVLAASSSSAGKTYREALLSKSGVSFSETDFSESTLNMPLFNAEADFDRIVQNADFVFCAVHADPSIVRQTEERFAKAELPVVSVNSANRRLPDVPVIIPEINPEHLGVLPFQKRRLGTKRGFIVTKSNCSLQSYVPLLHPLRPFGIKKATICTCQAISGAGKTFDSMPEISDNVIPYIAGEEEKSETEPLKIWGNIENGKIVPAAAPLISARCFRVPVSHGHTAAIFISFDHPPEKDEIIRRWNTYKGLPQRLRLPSAPQRFIRYFPQNDRPQPRLDRNEENGMTICAGGLCRDSVSEYKFTGLSHNLLRGAAGGAILLAELLAAEDLLD